MKKRIALLGAPASGKGTQAEMIQSRYQIPITSPGAMLREEKRRGSALGLEAAELTKKGKLLPDSMIVNLTQTWLEKEGGNGFVLDGFPRTIGQANALEEMLGKRGTPLDIVLALEANVETLQSRVASRMVCLQCGAIVSVGLHVPSAGSECPRCGGALARRTDDSPETLVTRLLEYREKTEPLLEYYSSRGLLQRVDSSSAPEVVFRSIAALLEVS